MISSSHVAMLPPEIMEAAGSRIFTCKTACPPAGSVAETAGSAVQPVGPDLAAAAAAPPPLHKGVQVRLPCSRP